MKKGLHSINANMQQIVVVRVCKAMHPGAEPRRAGRHFEDKRHANYYSLASMYVGGAAAEQHT